MIETELKSATSTYAYVAQTSSYIHEGKFKVLGLVIKDKRASPKVVINGARKNSGLKIVGKIPKRKAVFLSRLEPDTTVNDIANFLAPLNLKFLQCHKPSINPMHLSTSRFMKTTFNSYLIQSFGLRVVLSQSFMIRNDFLYFIKTFVVYAPKLLSSVASVEYDAICVTEIWLCEVMDSWHLFDDRYLVYRKERGSSANSNRRGGGVLVAIKKCISSRNNWTFLAWISKQSGFQ
ncbi:hypothetical protein AVEN_141310-1 [Araneus ventricosus]|uniref:Uncharacterized protein n=1 Tax=Araneus ventricosus TaxID=182803 RepID=A0A4Y2SRG2_ARAVE|nr:hypothetical protein AVEN_141310-1 [Araneus ventricosus]